MHRRKRAAERLEAAETFRPAAKRKKGLSLFHSEKRAPVALVVQEEGAKKCQPKEHPAHGTPVRSEDDSKFTDGEEVEVRTQGS